MDACGQCVVFLHHHRAVCQIQPEKLLDHYESFLAAEDLCLWIKLKDAWNQGTVIWLHVLDNQVIQFASV